MLLPKRENKAKCLFFPLSFSIVLDDVGRATHHQEIRTYRSGRNKHEQPYLQMTQSSTQTMSKSL